MSSDRPGDTSASSGKSPGIFVSEAKGALTIDELCTKLRDKGFAKSDNDIGNFILSRISYQHLSDYFPLFAENKIKDPECFTLYTTVMFDREIQALLIKYIGSVELQFRAQYSYHLSLECGTFAHKNAVNFASIAHFRSSYSGLQKELERKERIKDKRWLKSVADYGDVPVWHAVEVMSFGTLSKFYRNTKSKNVKRAVADSFNVDADVLISWLHTLTDVRNICCHFGRLLGTRLPTQPKRIKNLPADNKSFFYVIPIIMKLLSTSEFYDTASLQHSVVFFSELFELFSKYAAYLEIGRIPDNWLETVLHESVMGVPVDMGNLQDELENMKESVRSNPENKQFFQ
jgi:abortive infection bacteriophage resistance protein